MGDFQIYIGMQALGNERLHSSYQELEEYVGHEVEDLEGYDLPEAV